MRIRGFTGCLARVLLVIAMETLTIAICVKVFGMGEGSTLSAVLAVLCVILAFAIYYDDDYNGDTNTQKREPKQVSQEYFNSIPHCPYCFSGNTTIDEYGNCLCFDCKAHWKEEDLT